MAVSFRTNRLPPPELRFLNPAFADFGLEKRDEIAIHFKLGDPYSPDRFAGPFDIGGCLDPSNREALAVCYIPHIRLLFERGGKLAALILHPVQEKTITFCESEVHVHAGCSPFAYG